MIKNLLFVSNLISFSSHQVQVQQPLVFLLITLSNMNSMVSAIGIELFDNTG